MNSHSVSRLAMVIGLTSPAIPAVRAVDIWDERPLRIIQNVEARFPTDLMASGVYEGEVHALLLVDANGKLGDCLITAYTHLELARELERAVRYWEYEPARERGEPIGQRVQMSFSFRSTGSIMSMTASTMVANNLNRMVKAKLIQLACKANELDRRPTILQSVSPHHPGKTLGPAQANGTASIDFYIDAEGQPRMPVMMRATNEAYAVAAAEALLQWRFEPPTSNGKPVAVRMVQEFIF